MIISDLINLCFEKNRNKHIDNGNRFYIDCYGYGVLIRRNNEYFVSKGILESFVLKPLNQLKHEELNHLYLVLKEVLKDYDR